MDYITATQLDDLLNKLVEWNQANGRKHLSLIDAKLYFPAFSDMDLLFRYLGEYKFEGHPIIDFIGSKTGMDIYINPYTKGFIKSGGFKKIFKIPNDNQTNIKEGLEIEFIKLQIKNLKNDVPKQAKFNMIATMISIIIAVAALIISLVKN